jgi:2-isopropylmalate synthase
MAGADRVEGTLMGNGERTGNTDIVAMAMNLYSQGVDPRLDLSNIVDIIEVVESCTEIAVGPRHPWAGELVYTAFSGSHQDAIRKSVKYHQDHQKPTWNVAYLPIDPRDIGRQYEAVVRINSQSGKGGVALVLERDYHIDLPKWMHMPLSRVVQSATEATGMEISPANILALYQQHFVAVPEAWALQEYGMQKHADNVTASVSFGGQQLQGQGYGALEALSAALQARFDCTLEVSQYDQHALMNAGTKSMAQACIELEVNGDFLAAVAVAEDTTQATLQAMLTAFSRSSVALAA